MFFENSSNMYKAWLNNKNIYKSKYNEFLCNLHFEEKDLLMESIIQEFNFATNKTVKLNEPADKFVQLLIEDNKTFCDESFAISEDSSQITIKAKTSKGLLYGAFRLLNLIRQDKPLTTLEKPKKKIRFINHWDNMDGSIERGYAGKSIYYLDNELVDNMDRIKDYARLLASMGINMISINNVNANYEATRLISDKISIVKTLNNIFKQYNIKTFVSCNFASPITLGDLDTCDPLDKDVIKWWDERCKYVYDAIPDFGGFLVKADSEGRPGPFTYNRNQAEGANLLANALKPYGGTLVWRCFVYNCQQDWRDKSIDRARAAYDNFIELDGKFLDNVYLQVKNGPMDFQVREPITPLFGAMKSTKLIMEFQITQEYTGQQIDICYLPPMWKEIINFDTYANGKGTYTHSTVEGYASVVNVGNEMNWTGHILAQANLYGYGRLTWDYNLDSVQIANEWTSMVFDSDKAKENINFILNNSWSTYEKYNAPLGIGWMVTPHYHYGVNIDGYEYDRWGTYHRADCKGIGMDRTLETGTGYTGQYFEPNKSIYNNIDTCPDELLLFFHHVPYTYVLKSGKTVLQHIYDTHFEGYEEFENFVTLWNECKEEVSEKDIIENMDAKLALQRISARDWRDVINTYFYRKSGINDNKNRKIYT